MDKFSLAKSEKICKTVWNAFAIGICIIFYIIVGCPIKTLTGISCAGCGMTRALFAAGTGHVRVAFHFHPLFWCVPIGVLCVMFKRKLTKRFINGMQYAAIILFLVVYVLRMSDPQCDVVTAEPTKSWIYTCLSEQMKENN